jgi:hypothetical protein
MATAALAFTGLTSCTNDDDPSADDNEAKTIKVSFYIDAAGATTRAINWKNLPEEEGTDAENYIDLNSLKISLYEYGFDDGGWWTIGGVHWPVTPSESLLKWKTTFLNRTSNGAYVEGELTTSEKFDGSQFRMLVEANYSGTSVASSSTGLGAVIMKDYFNFEHPFEPSTTNPIPMSGYLTCKDITIYNDRNTNLGTIPMIRALAKIEVYPKNSKTKIEDVRLQRCLNKGNVNPFYATPNDLNGLLDRLEVPTSDHLSIPGESKQNTGYPSILGQTSDDDTTNAPLAFTEHKDADGNTDYYYIYVPEYRTTGLRLDSSYGLEADPNNKILLKVNDGTDDSYIELKEYNNGIAGSSINIIRNHIYRYTVEATDKVNINYVVIPWDEKEADPITFE